MVRYDPTDRRIKYRHSYVAGLDVGQINDSTAVGVLEVVEAQPMYPHIPEFVEVANKIPPRYLLRGLERFPLGMRYPDQVRRVVEIMRKPQLAEVRLFMDRTGVGLGFYDLLKEARVQNLNGVQITGSQAEATRQPYGWNVGKAELVTQVQILLQTRQLQFEQSLPDVALLERELKEFRATINSSGNTSFNAREGQHDDLVLALALAVFGAQRPRPVHSLDMRFAS